MSMQAHRARGQHSVLGRPARHSDTADHAAALAHPPTALTRRRARADAHRARRRQIYNQIYNATYSGFRQGTNPPPLNYSSPVLSHAVIQVSFSTRSFYQVSDANGVCTGPVYNFVSPPRAAPALPSEHAFSEPRRPCVVNVQVLCRIIIIQLLPLVL